MVIMGPPFTLISIVKPKRGVERRVPRREGLGPTRSHRVPPNPVRVPRREELGTGSHRARFGSHRRKELGPTGSHQVRIGRRARLVVLRARYWVQKMLMLPASTKRASIAAAVAALAAVVVVVVMSSSSSSN